MANKLPTLPPAEDWVSATGLPHSGILLDLVFNLQVERDRWQKLAMTDPLTGLPNRRALEEFLNNALNTEKALGAPYEAKETGNELRKDTTRTPVGVAIGFIDLDDFKRINDVHGHKAGDNVLEAVATFLSTTLRETDGLGLYRLPQETKEMAGRLGGDEFVMILRHTDIEHLRTRHADIQSTLNMMSIEHEGVTIPIRGTLGLIDCDLELSAAENMKIADAKMYEQKSARKAAAIALQEEEQAKRDLARFTHILRASGLNI